MEIPGPPAIDRLTPDELYRRFNTVISAGVFPGTTDPPMVYSWASSAMVISGTPKLKACASASITSAGMHAPDKNGQRVDSVTGTQGNIAYADRLLQTALNDNADIVSTQTTLNPAMMGKLHHRVPHPWWSVSQKGPTWSQQDYLRVCFSHILGLGLDTKEEDPLSIEERGFWTKVCMTGLYAAHAQLTKAAGVDERMNDKSLPESERSQAYLQFSTSFLDSVHVMTKAGYTQIQPARYLIKLIGAHPEGPRSLGVGAELALAQAAGTLPLELALAGDQWDLRQLGDIYANLHQERGAPFAAPAGKLALALSTYIPQADIKRLDIDPIRAALEDPITFAVQWFRQNIPRPADNPEVVAEAFANACTHLAFDPARAGGIFSPATVKRLLHDEYPPKPGAPALPLDS